MSRTFAASAILGMAFVLAGCAYDDADTYNPPGEAIADAIRDAKSPLVMEVLYDPGDPLLDPANIGIRMTPDADGGAAETVLCGPVAAALREGRPPEGLSIDMLDSSGAKVLNWMSAAEAENRCPGGSPAPSLVGG